MSVQSTALRESNREENQSVGFECLIMSREETGTVLGCAQLGRKSSKWLCCAVVRAPSRTVSFIVTKK